MRRGLAVRVAGKAVAFVQLAVGRQLLQPEDAQQAVPRDACAMPIEQRNALKRRILAQHPHLVQELTGDIGDSGA